MELKSLRPQYGSLLSELSNSSDDQQSEILQKLTDLIKEDNDYAKSYFQSIFNRSLKMISRQINYPAIDKDFIAISIFDDSLIGVSLSVLPDMEDSFADLSNMWLDSLKSLVLARRLSSLVRYTAVNGYSFTWE